MGIRLYDGRLIKNPNQEYYSDGYNNITKYTAIECIPDNKLLGVINFGSPLPLFYPDTSSDFENPFRVYQDNLIKYINKNDLFFLTLNFLDDTLSLKSTKNYPKKCNNTGFVYTYMKEKSPSTFLTTHYTYWKYPKRFARMMKNGYIEACTK